MTPAAAALLHRLQADREFWSERWQDDDMHISSRLIAQARRDLLDSLLVALPHDIEAIERDAVAGADAEAERLDRVLGWV